MMGCVIFPLLIVLIMEMILRSAEVNTNEITGPPMKAFMDDVTLVTKSRSHMEQLVTRLQDFFKQAAMKIKPLECRSSSIIKGNYRQIKFSVDGTKSLQSGKNALSVLVAATPQHILIDIVVST